MTKTLKVAEVIVWNNTKIGWPPIESTFSLPYPEIEKAQLSFKFDMKGGLGTKLDIEQPIRVNGQILKELGLPHKQSSDLLEFVVLDGIEIKPYLKTAKGEINTIQVNYRVSMLAHVPLAKPGATIGTLTAIIRIHYADDVPPPNAAFCMWCGQSIQIDAKVCGYCTKPPPAGGDTTKNCVTCNMVIPLQANYCKAYGHKQSVPEGTKLCVTQGCDRTLGLHDNFCPKCGNRQPDVAP